MKNHFTMYLHCFESLCIYLCFDALFTTYKTAMYVEVMSLRMFVSRYPPKHWADYVFKMLCRRFSNKEQTDNLQTQRYKIILSASCFDPAGSSSDWLPWGRNMQPNQLFYTVVFTVICLFLILESNTTGCIIFKQETLTDFCQFRFSVTLTRNKVRFTDRNDNLIKC